MSEPESRGQSSFLWQNHPTCQIPESSFQKKRSTEQGLGRPPPFLTHTTLAQRSVSGWPGFESFPGTWVPRIEMGTILGKRLFTPPGCGAKVAGNGGCWGQSPPPSLSLRLNWGSEQWRWLLTRVGAAGFLSRITSVV